MVGASGNTSIGLVPFVFLLWVPLAATYNVVCKNFLFVVRFEIGCFVFVVCLTHEKLFVGLLLVIFIDSR